MAKNYSDEQETKYKLFQASRDCLYWQYGNEHATNALQCINAVSYESKTSYEAQNQMSGTKFCYKGKPNKLKEKSPPHEIFSILIFTRHRHI